MKSMICEDIQNQHHELSIEQACHLAGVSRHAYVNWVIRPPIEIDSLTPLIKQIADENKSYGYRTITHELERRERKANHKRVLKIMQTEGITGKIKQSKIHTTNSNHNLRTYPNLIKSLIVVGLNKVWTSDITYIRLANGTLVYLSVIMDRFSRKFLGWQLSYNIDAQLCIDALKMAFKEREREDLSELIHHSDQGVQYASNEYVTELEKRGIRISMSRKGNPYDNAHMERAIKTIKYEEVYMDEYQSFSDAYNNIKHFIEEVYNKKRLHSAIGYKPPAEFEQQYSVKEVVA